MNLVKWVSIGIAYDHPLLNNPYPVLVIRRLNGIRWQTLGGEWFRRDVWPWWPPERRRGRLSA
jgi:hypothetical protein